MSDSLCSWMAFGVHVLEPVFGNMGINLCCGNIGVA